MIFGCLFSSRENAPCKNMYLGAYSIKESKSCKNLLIDNTFTNVVYTLHNDISKHSKLFSSNQKIELDRRKLNEKIKYEKIESKVTFIQKNLSIEEIVSLIDMHEP